MGSDCSEKHEQSLGPAKFA
jgi:hypothetical protein